VFFFFISIEAILFSNLLCSECLLVNVSQCFACVSIKNNAVEFRGVSMQFRTAARVRHNVNGFGVSRFRDTLHIRTHTHTHKHTFRNASTSETSLWHSPTDVCNPRGKSVFSRVAGEIEARSSKRTEIVVEVQTM